MSMKSHNNYKKQNKNKSHEQIDKTKIDDVSGNNKQPTSDLPKSEHSQKFEHLNVDQQTVPNASQTDKDDQSQVKNKNPNIANENFSDVQKTMKEVQNPDIHDQTSNIDYKKLYDEQKIVFDKMRIQYANLTDELNKTRHTLESERKQLIFKLEEKSKVAQTKIDEKISKLEAEKKQEVEKLKSTIAEETILAFLEPILLFESTVLNSPSNNPMISAYLQGYNMIINMFKEQLDHLGVEQINVKVGETFNENYMSAFDVEANPGFATNKVIRIVSKGFVLKKKIIKYASVIVAK